MVEYKKIVPCLDMKGGRVVKGVQFVNIRDAGDPVELAKYYQKEGADELVFLDISATVEKRKTAVDLASKVAKNLSIPFCVGGGITSLEDARAILEGGASKVSINSAAVKRPELLAEISREFGSNRLVLAIDVKRVYVDSPDQATDKTLLKEGGRYFWFDVLINGGTKSTGMDAIQWAKQARALGIGELLPTSKDTDGTKAGYDLEITRLLKDATGLPVTASGGAGTLQHILEAFTIGKADAALAASIFHFREVTIKQAKEYCIRHGVPMKV